LEAAKRVVPPEADHMKKLPPFSEFANMGSDANHNP
jgi:hypothetical protein